MKEQSEHSKQINAHFQRCMESPEWRKANDAMKEAVAYFKSLPPEEGERQWQEFQRACNPFQKP